MDQNPLGINIPLRDIAYKGASHSTQNCDLKSTSERPNPSACHKTTPGPSQASALISDFVDSKRTIHGYAGPTKVNLGLDRAAHLAALITKISEKS